MGWHNGQLLLALIAACTDAPGGISPVEWHVVDPATGNRKATITGICQGTKPGILNRWPSPAGVACADFQFRLTFYNWSGAVTGNASQREHPNAIQTRLSPTERLFFSAAEASQ